MKPNRDENGNPVTLCIKCVNIDVDVGVSPCTPNDCEISAILSRTFQYLEKLKTDSV